MFLNKKIKIRFLTLFSLVVLICSCSNDNAGDTPTPDPDPVTTTFKNPIYDSAGDPWVFQDNGYYYVTYTTGNNVKLIKTQKMSELKTSNAFAKIVWNPTAGTMNSSEIWAPEIHKVDGAWYIYYAASNGVNETHRMWVLKNTASDPTTGTWEDVGELELPDDKWAIDGTIVKINDKLYYSWSGWEGDVNVKQNIYICEMESPTKATGNRVLLLTPTYAWEKNGTSPEVIEAPQFFIKNDKVFIFYSAGACWTDGYSIGAIWMDIANNPLDANSWQRMENNPLFKASASAYGPGHNSFFKSLDGTEDWILYHANPAQGQGCAAARSMRMQKISWTTNDFPVLGTPEPTGKSLNVPAGE